jgi:hypothetical protein
MNRLSAALLKATSFVVVTSGLVWAAGAITWGREDPSLMEGAVLSIFTAAAPLPGPLYSANGVLYGFLAAAALFVAGKLCWMLVRGLWRVTALLLRGRRPALGDAGQAMTEVAISFPVLLITTLILMQLALMFQARNVVTYAAFSAARAAIVWIPASIPTEDTHVIQIDGGTKIDKIQQAAAMACVPISPKASNVMGGVPFIGDLIASSSVAFTSLVSVLGLPSSYAENGLQRYAYSSFATKVFIYKATENGIGDGGGFESGLSTWTYPENPADVAVLVEHNYYLSIPVVNRIIGDSATSLDFGSGLGLSIPGRFTTIRSFAVLPLEGTTGNPPITGFWDT